MLPLQHAHLIINTVRLKTNRVILFYSCGKDSLVLLDLLTKSFDEVVLVFMYFVKDLEHINIYLNWAKEKYGDKVKIIQVPHWLLTRIYKAGVYCKPNPKITLLELKNIDASIKLQTGIGWSFYGMKKADSLNRNLMLRGYLHEGISEVSGKAYPLSLWKTGDVLKYIKFNRLLQPIQYGNAKSNGITFDIDVFLFLQKNWPQDLRKILKAFPLSEQILYKHENKVPST